MDSQALEWEGERREKKADDIERRRQMNRVAQQKYRTRVKEITNHLRATVEALREQMKAKDITIQKQENMIRQQATEIQNLKGHSGSKHAYQNLERPVQPPSSHFFPEGNDLEGQDMLQDQEDLEGTLQSLVHYLQDVRSLSVSEQSSKGSSDQQLSMKWPDTRNQAPSLPPKDNAEHRRVSRNEPQFYSAMDNENNGIYPCISFLENNQIS